MLQLALAFACTLSLAWAVPQRPLQTLQRNSLYQAELNEIEAEEPVYPKIPLHLELNEEECRVIGDGEIVESELKTVLAAHLRYGIWENVTKDWEEIEEKLVEENIRILSIDGVDSGDCVIDVVVQVMVAESLLNEIS